MIHVIIRLHVYMEVRLHIANADFIKNHQGPDFDDISSFFLCEIDDAIQYINLGYGAQAPKIVILLCIFSSFSVFLGFRSFL